MAPDRKGQPAKGRRRVKSALVGCLAVVLMPVLVVVAYAMMRAKPPSPPDRATTITPEMAAVAATGSHPLISWQTPFLPFLFDDWRAFIRETVDQRMWFNRFYADSDPPTGLMGPADDLARFLLAFLNGGEYQGRRILSEETVALMSTESIIPVGNSAQTDADFQGLGWEAHRTKDVKDVEGTVEFLAHGGGGPGFGCAMRVYPGRGLGVAVLANDTTYDRAAILDLVAQLEW